MFGHHGEPGIGPGPRRLRFMLGGGGPGPWRGRGHRPWQGEQGGTHGPRGFQRRFITHEEQVSDLREYLAALEAEAKGVREEIARLEVVRPPDAPPGV